MSTQPMMFPSEWSERMAYKRAKAVYWPYDIEDLRHFCALRDLRIEELKADNAKLRELVRDMHAVISDRNSWWDCMRKDTRRFADRMRELGVEVDE